MVHVSTLVPRAMRDAFEVTQSEIGINPQTQLNDANTDPRLVCTTRSRVKSCRARCVVLLVMSRLLNIDINEGYQSVAYVVRRSKPVSGVAYTDD
jgi:hypothetical protein